MKDIIDIALSKPHLDYRIQILEITQQQQLLLEVLETNN